MLGFILMLLISGLVVGALARLIVPGRDPMSIWMTIALGVAGSFIGGLIGRALFGRPGGMILAVICSAGLVLLYRRMTAGGRRSALH
jgi:uncharacterized membrane protein YeaQ/YmgE (transglycosylase-associated protein family)